MISDTLSDSEKYIQDYLNDFPETYKDGTHEVNLIYKALEAMAIARIALDTPPKHFVKDQHKK